EAVHDLARPELRVGTEAGQHRRSALRGPEAERPPRLQDDRRGGVAASYLAELVPGGRALGRPPAGVPVPGHSGKSFVPHGVGRRHLLEPPDQYRAVRVLLLGEAEAGKMTLGHGMILLGSHSLRFSFMIVLLARCLGYRLILRLDVCAGHRSHHSQSRRLAGRPTSRLVPHSQTWYRSTGRSEERRVGKECRRRWAASLSII